MKMTYEELHQFFRLVDLKDRSTWKNAPIQCWIDLRKILLDRIPDEKEKNKLLRAAKAAHRKAIAELKREEKARGHHLGRFLSGRQESRYNSLLRKHISTRVVFPFSLSKWDKEFLQKSSWVNEILEIKRPESSVEENLILLFNWLKVSDLVRQELLEYNKCIASAGISHQSGVGLPRGKHGFLPDSIELLQLYRLAYLFLQRLREGFSLSDKHNLLIDNYMSAFPCPACKEKFYFAAYAEQCCGDKYPEQYQNDYYCAIPIGSPDHRLHLNSFYFLLWRHEYDTPTDPAIAFTEFEWSEVMNTSIGKISNKFLGFVFSSNSESVRRRLTLDKLDHEYERYGIRQKDRDYLGKERLGRHSELRAKEWYKGKWFHRSSGICVGKRMAINKWSPPY